jgi:hypothetical protein
MRLTRDKGELIEEINMEIETPNGKNSGGVHIGVNDLIATD